MMSVMNVAKRGRGNVSGGKTSGASSPRRDWLYVADYCGAVALVLER
jgi:dTDP-D-glucose 4,6-dehydratase